MTRLHSYGVASFLFRDVVPGAIGDLPWPRDFLREIFIDNVNSMRNYWRRASLGFLDLEFEFINSGAWIFEEHTQQAAQCGGCRYRTLDAARAFFADNDIAVNGYDHLVVVVPPMPIDWGATSSPPVDIVFEQIDTDLRYMQHEFGHSLGFMHAFGPFVPPPSEYGSVYNDPYCVMGYTGTYSHGGTPPMSASLANRPKAGASFWNSERRPSAASLWRHLAEMKLSRERVTYVETPAPTRVRIFGLCAADSIPMTILAVVPRRGHPNQFITVEYRPPVGDDAGVDPAVVVHTVGVNPVGAGHGEVDPPWYEGTIPLAVNASMDLHDYRITLTAVSTTPPESVEVEIQALD